MTKREEAKGKKIDVDKIDLEKHKEYTTENPGLIEFAHHLGSIVIRPEDKGKIKGKAVAAMYEQTEQQMGQLYRQMENLAQEAKRLKERVDLSERIYQAEMNFEPLIGHVYYLYQKKDSMDQLSMIGPEEWGRSFPYEHFLASVKLMSDHTWDILERGEDQDL